MRITKVKSRKGITAIRGTSVYVVLEHSYGNNDAVVHGVYSDRITAIQKALKISNISEDHGYLAILRKPIQGRKEKVDHLVCEEFGVDEYRIDNK